MVQWRQKMESRAILEPVLPQLAAAEKILIREAGSRVGLVAELHRHTPIGKGKKIRAAFFFLLARLNRARGGGPPDLGAAIEMLHLSSLVHDDIVDHSGRRRGQQTPNRHFGDAVSVLWGDFLFISAMRMLTRSGRGDAVSLLAEASRRMIEGQILEFANSFNYRLAPRTYYEIIRRKTASLFESIAALAARLPGGSPGREQEFRRFGRDFGMIFQVGDDLLDLFSGQSGKGRFQDLKEGKVTLPYILLVQGGALPLIRSFDPARPGPLLERCRSLEVLERSRRAVDPHHRRCLAFLGGFPPSPHRDALRSLLAGLRCREH